MPETPHPTVSGATPGTEVDALPALGKARLRGLLLDRRRALPPRVWDDEAGLLAEGVLSACAVAGVPAIGTVCAYVPMRTEPGSAAMLERLRASGRRVLLPIIPGGAAASVGSAPGGAASGEPADGAGPSAPAGGPLSWALYLGLDSLVAGPLGIRRPPGPDLGAAAIAEAALVLIPALAVDRLGVRLGRGGGWYDRTLALARPGTSLLAVLRDEEVVDELPCEPHDVRVTGVVTPTAGPRSFRPPLD